MPNPRQLIFVSVLLIAAIAAGGTTAFTNAHLIPISSPDIESGVVVITDGKIVAVGAAEFVKIPANAHIRDVAGKTIMPGLVDTHSHVGGISGGDGSAPLQPEVRVADSFDARDPGIQRAQAGGVTTANVMPGSGHLMSGQTLYLKYRDGDTLDELALKGSDGELLGGMKMANGTNSRRDPPFPGTRAKSAALVRARFIEAQEYRDKIQRAAKDPDKDPPDRDLGLEAMVEVLEGKRIVHHHTHWHDDVLTVLRLADEFGFRVVLQHVSDAWKIADEIAAAGVGSSLIVVDSPGGKLEARDIAMRSGAVLEELGAPVAFHTDDPITDSRLFLRSAALAVRAGMTRDGALRALTAAPAAMMDLEDRIGALEAGFDADLVILDGDPLSVWTKVEETWVDGVRVFNRSDPEDRSWAEGGWGAGSPGRRAHVHGEWE